MIVFCPRFAGEVRPKGGKGALPMLSSLNQRAALQAKTLMPDGGGGYSENWQTFALIWIGIVPLTPSERFGPDRLETKARHRLRLRRRNDLAVGQRVVVGDRRFAVLGLVDEGPPSPLITLLCEELP